MWCTVEEHLVYSFQKHDVLQQLWTRWPQWPTLKNKRLQNENKTSEIRMSKRSMYVFEKNRGQSSQRRTRERRWSSGYWSSWPAEQEVRGSIPRIATWISEIGYLPLPSRVMAEIPLKRRKSSIQPTNQPKTYMFLFNSRSLSKQILLINTPPLNLVNGASTCFL